MARRSRKRRDDTVYTAEVSDLDHHGNGVARSHGKVVFIAGALPGETVRFRIQRKRSKFDFGKLEEIVTASPDRVTPPCEVFGVCGGCSLQHLRYAAQINFKQSLLREQLQHVGNVEPQTWLAPLSSEPWHYRRKARLGVRLVPKKGGILVGFREKGASYITGLQGCHVLDRHIAEQLPALHKLITGMSCPNRIPQIEVAAGDNELAFIFRNLDPLTDADENRFVDYGKKTGIQIYKQPAGPDSIARLWPVDAPALSYTLPAYNLCFNFRPTDFTQVNAGMNQLMIEQALALLGLNHDDRVLDLFCGLGNFTLPIATEAGQVLGIEADELLITAARVNASNNKVANADFRCADLYQYTEELPWHGFSYNKLLLDPPRSGALEVLERLPEAGPDRIVYVSCNPATLARDTDYLVSKRGYTLVQAGILDMFPQTSHVESMAMFEKNH
ncbi:MAG: 23S rRNA (uracil(1939)-C(5))-methyltransferase RlmD [Gammaproteobacteria bacterium]|nr:MAG: 23S rRNA (uracil(1939)-C(5))-methyltransferase RlmD [Gammaproteobacteria bacterium]